jgi:hypothetical protein
MFGALGERAAAPSRHEVCSTLRVLRRFLPGASELGAIIPMGGVLWGAPSRLLIRMLSVIVACATLSCGAPIAPIMLGVQFPQSSQASASKSLTAAELEAADAELAAVRPSSLTPAPPPMSTPQIRVEGRLASPGTGWADAVRSHAAALIPCPEDKIIVQSILLGAQAASARCVPGSRSCWTFADGCGQRVVYGSTIPNSSNMPLEFYVTARFTMPPIH